MNTKQALGDEFLLFTLAAQSLRTGFPLNDGLVRHDVKIVLKIASKIKT